MKSVYFDLDGTLLHFTREYRDVLTDTFVAVLGESRDEWIDSYNEAFYELFMECEPEPVRRAFARIEDGSTPDTLMEELRRQEVKMCRPPDDIHTDLRKLAEKHKLGVLTNGVREWQKHKLEAYDLDQYFDAFVASYEVGAHKPDIAPYRVAEQRLPADTYAMVGDDDTDIEGAKNAGWVSYRYNGQGFGELPDVLRRD
jgi:putative hydrolase of the HAD superfamily